MAAAPTQAEDKREASASGTPPVHRSAPMRYGVTLICFALGFSGGLALGATARLDGWFSPKPQLIQFTWVRYGLAEPPSAEAALYWLYLQGVLQARGFSDDQMKALYLLQAKDWTIRAPVAALFDPQKPATPASAAQGGKGGFIVEEVMRQMQQSGNPIVNQPPKKTGPTTLPG